MNLFFQSIFPRLIAAVISNAQKSAAYFKERAAFSKTAKTQSRMQCAVKSSGLQKSYAAVILCAVLIFIPCACTARADPLEYTKTATTYDGVLTREGTAYGVSIAADPQTQRTVITLRTPATLEGVTLTISDGTLSTAYGDMNIPINAASVRELAHFCGAFYLASEDIANVGAYDGGLSVLECKNQGGSYEILLHENGSPVKISANGYVFTAR